MYWNLVLFTALQWVFIGTIFTEPVLGGVGQLVDEAGLPHAGFPHDGDCSRLPAGTRQDVPRLRRLASSRGRVP